MLISTGIYRYLKARWLLKAELEAEHKEAERLKELDVLKNRLYTNVSHEFRTPLTLISGPVTRQLSKEGLDPEQKEDLKLIQRNSDRLLSLVDQLMDLSKLETGNLKISVKNQPVKPLLTQLISLFKYQAEEKNILFRSETSVKSAK